jgi:Hydrazine synthase alpha subunit middle domain
MARIPSRRRVLRALALPFLAAIGFSVAGCGSSSDQKSDGPTLKNVQQLVYAVRQSEYIDAQGNVVIDVAGGMGQVLDYLRYDPGARLELLDLASGNTENIIEDFKTADISGLDLSFDATKVVFSMKQNGDDSYHIYWATLARGDNGKFEIHQLTFGEADDVQPVWLAGDRIAFVTNEMYTEMGTRADEYNHSRTASQVATVTVGGGDADRRLCSQNLSNSVTPFSMSDGRLGFTRWEHLENVNDSKLFSANPDCTQVTAIAGQHGKPSNSLVQAVETNDPNVFVAIATARNRTIQSGALVKIDTRNADGRVFEEQPSYEILTDAVPRDKGPSPVGRYRTPAVLPDGRIIVSWAPGFVNDLNELSQTPPDYGIYVYDPETRTNQLIKDYPKSWEVFVKPVVKRVEPPVIGSIQNTKDSSVPVRIGSIDIKQTSLASLHKETVSGAQFDNTPMDEALAQAKTVRVIEGFSSEAAYGVTMFGLTMAEGAAVLGEAPVYDDGSWLAEIPAYVPVHLQAVDEFGLAIRNQTLWIQGMPGEDRVCGGCHEERGKAINLSQQQLTQAAGAGPLDFNRPIPERTEYPWYKADPGFTQNEIQALLNAKCVSCHTGGETYTVTMTNQVTGVTTSVAIPRFDLSETPITVTYDKKTATYPSSYVSIFYPAALEMSMDNATITGTVPPKWAIPSDARNSAMIEKLNLPSSVDANKTAWALGQAFSDPGIKGGTRTMHPEDVGGSLTDAERLMLVRAIDMGGQYYARQNTQFQPYSNDPVAGGQQY